MRLGRDGGVLHTDILLFPQFLSHQETRTAARSTNSIIDIYDLTEKQGLDFQGLG